MLQGDSFMIKNEPNWKSFKLLNSHVGPLVYVFELFDLNWKQYPVYSCKQIFEYRVKCWLLIDTE